MESYTLDPKLISLERFHGLSVSKRMVPGRAILKENTDIRQSRCQKTISGIASILPVSFWK